MSQNEKQQTNSSVEIEDLTAEKSTQNEVKGGSGTVSGNNLKQMGLSSHSYNDV